MKKSAVLIILTLLPGLLKAVAQGSAFTDPDIEISMLTQRDGLPDNSIRSLFADSRGFLWIGTLNGLCRYDGYSFITLKSAEGYLPLGGSRVRDIKEDTRGLLWIGIAPERVSCFDPHRGVFVDYTGCGKSDAPFRHFAFDADVVWLWGDDITMEVSIKDGRFTSRMVRDSVSAAIRGKGEKGVIVDNAGALWRRGGKGVLRYLGGKGEAPFSLRLMSEDMARRKVNERYSIEHDYSGHAWIGTNGSGLYEVDLIRGRALRHLTVADTPQLLSDDILSIASDGAGGVWAGMEYAGLAHITRRRVSSARRRPFGASSTADNHIRHLLGAAGAKTAGDILVSNNSGSLKLMDSTMTVTKREWHYQGNVSCMTIDRQGRLWTGVREEGVYVDGRLFNKDNSSLSIPAVFSMLCDRKGRVWVGTLGGGLNLAEMTGGDVSFRVFLNESYGQKRVRALCEDASGMIWAGTSNGVYVFHPDSLIAGKNACYEYNTAGGALLSDEVRSIFRAGDGMMYIAETGGGFCVCRPAGDYSHLAFTHYTKDDGLISSMVMAFAEDNNGVIWVSTEGGLSAFSPSLGSIITSLSSTSSRENVYSENCAMTAADGSVLFGSLEGVTMIRPQERPAVGERRTVTFTGIAVNGNIQGEYGLDSPMSLSLAYSDGVRLSHDENTVRIDFSTLDRSGMKSEYSYFLEGYDKQWSGKSFLNTAEYKNLPPGDYRFRVKTISGKAGGGRESVLRLRILQPWWNSAWAWIVYILVFLALAFLAARHIRHVMTLSANMRIARQVTAYRDAFFMNVSHEFRTPITLILASIEQMSDMAKSQPALRRLTGVLKRNSQRLLSLVNELLEVRKLQDGKLSVKMEPAELRKGCQRVVSNFSSAAINKKLTLTSHYDFEQLTVYTDSDKVETILTNLLSNAIKYTPQGGTVTLFMSYSDGQVKVSVTDSGIGIKKEKRDMLFQRFATFSSQSGGIGIGLYYTRELTEALGGKITYRPNDGGGSVFEVLFPAERTAAVGETQLFDADRGEIAAKSAVNDCHILIVDDEDDMREFLVDALSPYFLVHQENNGKAGLDYAAANDVDLLVCDVMMESMSGFEVVKRLRGDFNTCHIPVILLTALSGDDSRLTGIESGADDYITKPFSTRLLLTRIRKLLEQREMLKEKFSNDPARTRPVISKSEQDKAFTDKLCEVAYKNMINENYTVDDFASDMGLGRTVFYRKVKGVTGYGPKEYIRIMRMKRAALLLLTPGVTVAEVAYDVGVNDPFYFSKLFKAQFGMPPSEYQKNHSETGK